MSGNSVFLLSGGKIFLPTYAIIMTMKKKIKEVVIVEGKHDAERLVRLFDVDVLVSNGTHLSQQFLNQLNYLNQQQGIIVFTDPDGPGNYIRRTITEAVGDCKHASLSLKQAKSPRKVGVEHASDEDIIEALEKVNTFIEKRITLSWAEFLDLGLSGRSDSQQKRNFLMSRYHLPKANAKTAFRYLNMIGVSYHELNQQLKEEA